MAKVRSSLVDDVPEQAMVDKCQSIHPLDGGYSGYIETLEDIRGYVDSKSALTKEDLKSWYRRKYGPGNADTGINSLFRSGLLAEDDNRIECMFPKGRSRNRRVVEIINDHVVYVLDMLNEARYGATEKKLHELGRSKHGLERPDSNQIRWRRGWLQSARFLEHRDRKLYATKLGQTILDGYFDHPASRPRPVNDAEFGGGGEGVNHRTLKEVCLQYCSESHGMPS